MEIIALLAIVILTVGFLWFIVAIIAKLFKKNLKLKYAVLTFVLGLVILFIAGCIEGYPEMKAAMNETIEAGQ